MKSRTLLVFLLVFLTPFALAQIWEATRIGQQQWELTSDVGEHVSWHQSEAEAAEKGQAWSLANDLRSFKTQHTGTRWDATAQAQILIGTQDNSETDVPPYVPPSETHFDSDVVIWPALGIELGSVPNVYADHQLIQTEPLDINRDTADYGFTLDGATTLVYVHITSNAHATYKPAFLTAGNGWTYSGNIGTVVLSFLPADLRPDIDT